MRATGLYRATIAPVRNGSARPLWSVMIPTYHCARYLREALEGVLVQDPGPDLMQIEVVDDHSTRDDPAAVVAELGRGRVTFHRQPRNVGHTENFRTCLERSRGVLVHLLHGDDRVDPGFYRALGAAFEAHREIGAAFCRHFYIGERGEVQGVSALEQPRSGILAHWLERIAVGQRIQTPSIVVRREVYETLGAFDDRLRWVEDWEMWVRIAAHYPVWYEVEALARYRIHPSSNTGRYMRSGENLRDVRRAIRIIRCYLHEEQARGLGRRSREHWAKDAILYRAPAFVDAGDLRAASIQVVEALRCSRSPRVIRLLAALAWRTTRTYLARSRRTLAARRATPPGR